jgi:flagellar motor protein MotB
MASHAEQPAHAAGDHPAEPGQSQSHVGGGSHAKHGKGHKDGHGAGAHGGTWLVTYCDMITLLIAFFIAIITFASQESGNQKYPKMRDSILYGAGGSGVAGSPHQGTDHDAVVWRQFLMAAQPAGSKTPPLYTDPSLDKTGPASRATHPRDLDRQLRHAPVPGHHAG